MSEKGEVGEGDSGGEDKENRGSRITGSSAVLTLCPGREQAR
jgi:hypothetical protein